MIRVNTLGHLSFESPTSTVELRSRKHAGLFIYLAFNQGKKILRDNLTELFWPSTNQDKARHSLSQAVYELRASIPALCIELDRHTVNLQAHTVSMDVLQLRDALTRRSLKEVVELDRGEFLDQFWLDGCPFFSDWQEERRSDLRIDLTAYYNTCVSQAERSGDWPTVLIAAEKYVRIDPYHEPSYQALAKACSELGRLDEATRWLDQAAQRLTHDLNTPLSSKTIALRESLEHARDVHDELNATTEEPSAPFIGRVSQFNELTRLVDAAVAGEGGAAAVVGEAGIGKSRLCDRLLRYAVLHGVRVLRGNCYQSERQLPMNGVLDALREGITTADVSRIPEPWRLVVGEFLPDKVADPTIAALDSSAEAQARRFEAVVQILIAVSAVSPVVLLIEDVHWASPSTASLLNYIVRRSTESRLVVLVSLRAGELDTELNDAQFLGPTSRFKEIVVSHFQDDEVAALVEAIRSTWEITLDESEMNRVMKRTAGQPFLLIEYLRQIRRDRVANDEPSSVEFPATIISYLKDALHRLTPRALLIAQYLAVSEKLFPLSSLVRVSGASMFDVLEALKVLESRNLVHRAPQGVGLIHDIVREFTYQSLLPDIRAELHRSIAEELAISVDVRPGLVAFHFDKARARDKAFAFARQAVDEARRFNANSDVVDTLRIAVRNAPKNNYYPTFDLAQSLETEGQFIESKSILEQLKVDLSKFAESGLSILVDLELVRLHYKKDAGSFRLDRFDALLARAEAFGDVDILMRTLSSMLHLTEAEGDEAWVTSTLRRLLRLASSRATASPSSVAAMASVAQVLGIKGKTKKGLQLAEHALRRARKLDSLKLAVLALQAMALNQLMIGDLRAASESFAQALEFTSRNSMFHASWTHLNNYGVLLIEIGAYSQAESVLLEALTTTKQADSVYEVVFALTNLCLLRFEEGRLLEARSAAVTVLTYDASASAWWNRVLACSILGLSSLAAGEATIARDYARQVERALSQAKDPHADLSYAYILLARLLEHDSKHSDALGILDGAIAQFDKKDPCCLLRLKFERARLLVAISAAHAIEECEAVVASAERMGAEPIRSRAAELLLSIQGSEVG